MREPHDFSRTEDVSATVDALPFTDAVFDRGFSVDTHHEYYSAAAMEELARTMRPDGRFVTVDWSANGTGESGPPLSERFGPESIVDHFTSVGFDVIECQERPETVVIVARR